MLVAFTGNSTVTILSTIARVSGGTYEPVLEQTRRWRENRRNQPLEAKEEEEFLREYLTPTLLCGRPPTVNIRRWFLKCLSNDQTAFTGFTSLVEQVEENFIGYDSAVRLVPNAAFIELFVLSSVSDEIAQRLLDLQTQLQSLDSTKVTEINKLLAEAERIAPVTERRTRGKAPIFFYSTTNKPFSLPRGIYQRMERTTQLISGAISDVATNFSGSLEEALFNPQKQGERQFFTGSVDFMLFDNEIYVIDIGAPAVGYIADTSFASSVLQRDPNYGLDFLAASAGEEVTLYKGKAGELGFFSFENYTLLEGLLSRGVRVTLKEGNESEISIKGKGFPTREFDYLTRNQALRNAILEAMSSTLQELGVSIPKGIVTILDRGELPYFYAQTNLCEDSGILVKKKVFFREYSVGSGYFKPLVVPLWSREFKNDRTVSTLYEQFIPSLTDVDVVGERKGKRSYEIRMYYCMGEPS